MLVLSYNKNPLEVKYTDQWCISQQSTDRVFACNIERVHCIMKVGLCKETKALRNTSRVAAFSIKHIDCTAQLPAVEIYSVKKTKTPEVPKLLVLQDNYPCFCAWEPQSWASSSEQYQFDSTTIHSFESRKPEKWDVDLPIHNSIYKLKEKKDLDSPWTQ